MNVGIERRRDLLGRMLPEPEDPLRLSSLLRASSGQVLEVVRKLGLEVLRATDRFRLRTRRAIRRIDQAPR